MILNSKLHKSIIRFILDGKIKEIDFSKTTELRPTTTVLNYLRSLPDHKGVKEGCAEGDCGACTVVLCELNENNKLSYKTITSCLVFLPMIHGKQLITVENLVDRNNKKVLLHPVQHALVKSNGSQCGYCTPGIIMSLFALYKNHNNPTREIIEDALTGNLCRCTGYQPIINAAQKACTNNGIDHFTEKEPEIVELLKQINKEEKTISIITETQKYFKPRLLSEALVLKRQYPNALIINGASEIALKQTKKYELLKEIIDLSDVDELKIFKENDKEFIIGTGLSLEKIKANVKDKLPAFYDLLKVFASLQIRNIATLGGNIASASPIGDTLPLLFAYKAKLKIICSDNERSLYITDFIKGYRLTDLKPDEIIKSVIIHRPDKKEIIKYYKVSKRKDLDISTLSAGFRLFLDKDKNIKEIILAYGGMAAFTKKACKTEKFLLNKKWQRHYIEKAMEILYREYEPISDARAFAESRRIAAKNLLLKLYSETSH